MSILRGKYWMLCGRKPNSYYQKVHDMSKKLNVNSLPLPFDRVRNTQIFEVFQIDFAGPVYFKSEKRFDIHI